MPTYSPLLTDFYQLTMAAGYWRLGMAEREAVFHLFFRRSPFNGRYAVAAGLEPVIHFLQNWHFKEQDLTYLETLCDAQGNRLFQNDFLDYLQQLRFQCDISAIEEGTVVFPQEPLIRVQGPVLQCQLIETALINFVNFSSLIATKAARVCAAAAGDPVVEFGLRRAQGPDGGLLASRAAYIGGCEAVSNALAGQMYGIPVRGTVAHSWVMVFPHETLAFEQMQEVIPGQLVYLVDTYDTLEGVDHVIELARRQTPKRPIFAVRLDSGDLLSLSCATRQKLDAAGLKETLIFASGDLDEYRIEELKKAGAPINMWGVGTRLVTAYDQPSLDVVYKISAIQDEQHHWQYRMKRSDQPEKTTNPGILSVTRYFNDKVPLGDCIYDAALGKPKSSFESAGQFEELLKPIFSQGQLIYSLPAIDEVRARCLENVKNFEGCGDYPVQLEPHLVACKNHLLNHGPSK